jgi:Transglycosylase SLT domain/SPOR domain
MTTKFSCLAVLVVAMLVVAGRCANAGDPEPVASDAVGDALCATITASATANKLPIGFFTRLIWKESSLRIDVTSPAGAQGIAQFMPGTAAARGLANPFDPDAALPEAAKFLAELSTQFGNLGLAAAAYNAGPTRLAHWLAGQGEMPLETRDFVLAITARPIEDWAKPQPIDPAAPDKTASAEESCAQIIVAMRGSTPAAFVGETPFAPWGVQLAGNFSKDLALAAFARERDRYKEVLGDIEPFVLATRLRSRGARAFFRVRLPSPTQAAAQQICHKLHLLGGSCIVLRS